MNHDDGNDNDATAVRVFICHMGYQHQDFESLGTAQAIVVWGFGYGVSGSVKGLGARKDRLVGMIGI